MLTAGAESEKKTQKRIERILKLHRAGHTAEWIADFMGRELALVKSVLMGNDQALTAELAKLLEQAEGLRCAYSRRLAFQPLRGPEGIIYERRVLEEWMLVNDTWPSSSTPIRAPLAEVDREVKEQVKQFSLRALEVVQNCIQRNTQREHALVLTAECLGVLNVDSNLNEFLGVLLVCSRDGQEAILGSFKHFRPSLLRKLLLTVAPMPNLCGLTLVLAEVLEEAQLNSKKVKASAFINTLKRTWKEKTHRKLSALMIVVRGRLYAKINERAKAENCLFEAELAPEPSVTELSELYEAQGELAFDLNNYNLAQARYEEAISSSKDAQTLRRLHLRLEHIRAIRDREQTKLREQARHREQAIFKEQESECRAQGESQLAYLYGQAASDLTQTEKLATIFSEIGLLYHHSKGDYLRAEEYLMKSLSIRQEVLPTNHPDLAGIFIILGNLYYSEGDYPKAEEYYLKCLSIWEEVLSASHPDLALIYNNLGDLYRNIGDNSKAEEYMMKGLTIWREVLPAKHPDLALIYSNLGNLYHNKGDYLRAEEYLMKGLSIRQEVLPANHTDLASIYNSLGELYRRKGDNSKAEEYLMKCLSIWQKVLPINHPYLAGIFINLGSLYYSERDDTRAEEYYLKCLSIWQQVLPANHPDLALIYNNLGGLYKIKGDSRRAEEYFLMCLSIWQGVLPVNHPNLALIYKNIGLLYKSKGDSRRAEEYFKLSKLTQS
jgi:tetratricopeptide (TPR) repeat protein